MAFSWIPFPSLLSQGTRNASHPLAPVTVPTTATGVFQGAWNVAISSTSDEDEGVADLLPSIASTCALLVIGGCGPPPSSDMTNPQSNLPSNHADWIDRRERTLAAPDGWLTLVGLVWLEPGGATIGTAPAPNERAIVLAGADAPHAGRFDLDGGTVRFTPAADGIASLDGRPLDAGRSVVLADDRIGAGPVLRVGRLLVTHIHRHDRAALRIKDPESPTRTGFKGVPRFDHDPAWILEGRFEAGKLDATMPIRLVSDHLEDHRVAGTVRFELDGASHALLVEPAGEGYFLVFGDRTNGLDTYGGGRFLSIPPADADGIVQLDFNRATTPPCSFTPFATCPTPPDGNRLPVEILAGEKRPEPSP